MAIISNIVATYVRRAIGNLLPACVRDAAVAWFKNLNTFIEEGSETIEGLLDFDGVDDIVTLSSVPDVTGSKTITFKMYLPSNIDNYGHGTPLYFKTNINDFIWVYIDSYYEEGGDDYTTISISTNENIATNGGVEITPFTRTGSVDTILEVEITKTAGLCTSVTVNNVSQSLVYGNGANDAAPQQYIGGYDDIGGLSFSENIYFWDLNINDEHQWQGQPAGNTDAAWVDTIGSIDGVVYGSPTTASIGNSITVVKDSIGSRTDDIYYGQYLDTTSGQINFYRTSGTFDYTDPSNGSLVEAVSIPATGLYTVPANGICDIGVYPKTGGLIEGLMAFDDSSYIELDSHPTISGNKTISFNTYFDKNTDYTLAILFSDGVSDFLDLQIGYDGADTGQEDWNIYLRLSASEIYSANNVILSNDVFNVPLVVEIIKTGDTLTSLKFNDIDIVLSANATTSPVPSANDYIYYYDLGGVIWDININDEHQWQGQPAGNTDAAWVDTIGSINGNVIGTPSTVNIDSVSDTTYFSFYPICERAGTVLHDVMDNSIHISVDTPVWVESLYGSDYLNQKGFVDKADFTEAGYDWETEVDGANISLNDSTLVPLRQE